MIARCGVLLLLFAVCSATFAQTPNVTGFADHRGTSLPDVRLQDEHGVDVRMSSFSQRPYFLAFAYHTCPQVCGLVLGNFSEALRKVDGQAGSDFDVVVVSIDPSDTTERIAIAKRKYVERYGGDARGWHFLRGDTAQVHELANAAGFDYVFDPIQRVFSHPAGILFVDRGGVVGGHLESTTFTPTDLQRLRNGNGDGASSLWNSVCGAFGFSGGARSASVMTALRVVAGSLFGLSLFAIVFVLQRHRRAHR